MIEHSSKTLGLGSFRSFCALSWQKTPGRWMQVSFGCSCVAGKEVLDIDSTSLCDTSSHGLFGVHCSKKQYLRLSNSGALSAKTATQQRQQQQLAGTPGGVHYDTVRPWVRIPCDVQKLLITLQCSKREKSRTSPPLATGYHSVRSDPRFSLANFSHNRQNYPAVATEHQRIAPTPTPMEHCAVSTFIKATVYFIGSYYFTY